jgi:hypothetical protein
MLLLSQEAKMTPIIQENASPPCDEYPEVIWATRRLLLTEKERELFF